MPKCQRRLYRELSPLSSYLKGEWRAIWEMVDGCMKQNCQIGYPGPGMASAGVIVDWEVIAHSKRFFDPSTRQIMSWSAWIPFKFRLVEEGEGGGSRLVKLKEQFFLTDPRHSTTLIKLYQKSTL